MRLFCRLVLLLVVGSVGCSSALARGSDSARNANARSECSTDASGTGSRIRRTECDNNDQRKRPVREKTPTDQIADALQQDVASGSTLSRAQTN